jgi:GNAT superfamily N-acetyltransferase
MHIRPATLADVPAVVRMSERFYATTSYNQWAPFNADTVEALAATLTESHVMLIAEHDGEAVGMVGLFVAPFTFNADRIGAYEVVWWVEPEGRATGAGKALLAAIQPACEARGCHSIQMVHLNNSPPQAAMLYERAGFTHTESSFTKTL